VSLRSISVPLCVVVALGCAAVACAQPAASGALFDAVAGADVIALAPEQDGEALAASLTDAGRNWTELAAAIRNLDGDERADCVWLVNGMPHLDRIEITADDLVEHVRYAHRARREMPYSMPDDMFRAYILTYRIEEEPLTPWRKELFERFGPVAQEERTAAATAKRINALLAESLEESEPDFFGPRKSPTLTLKSGNGSEADISILACAAMKAVGIPSRQASVPALGEEPDDRNWVEIFDGERWLPLFPLEPDAFGDFGRIEAEHRHNVTVVATRTAFEQTLVTERYTETGVIDVALTLDGAPAAGFDAFSISVLNHGGLAALDALETVADDAGRFSAAVGEGTYVVAAGTRDAAGNPFVMMREVGVAPGDTVVVDFDVSPAGAAPAIAPEELSSVGTVLKVRVEFDPDEEPSVRMLPLIKRALDRFAPAVRTIYVPVDGALLPAGTRLPLVVCTAADGAAILRREGYDLNIGRALSAAVDAELLRALGRPVSPAEPVKP
jgi:hypothetical protein